MIVLWSGGCDSTLALYNLATNKPKNERLVACSIVHNQTNWWRYERKARNVLKEEFKKRGLRISYQELRIVSNGIDAEQGEGSPLPLLWMWNAFVYAKSTGETIYTGYHQGDQFWKNDHVIDNIAKAASKILERKITVEHPLSLTDKSEILKALHSNDLLHLCRYCITLSDIPCGTCMPCRTHRLAQLDIKLEARKNDRLFNPRPAKRNEWVPEQKMQRKLADPVDEGDEVLEAVEAIESELQETVEKFWGKDAPISITPPHPQIEHKIEPEDPSMKKERISIVSAARQARAERERSGNTLGQL